MGMELMHAGRMESLLAFALNINSLRMGSRMGMESVNA